MPAATVTRRVKAEEVNASGMHYRELNALLRSMTSEGPKRFRIANVCGQRFIASDLPSGTEIEIIGTPGNDLAAFMDGAQIVVRGNAQDGCGNTMNSGEIIVHGRAGDIVGMSMRGGAIFIRDDVGYRGAIHMKEYQDRKPMLVVGGTAQDFFGEYMAGGISVLLGLTGIPHRARYIGTGMHGGVIYIRGSVEQHQLGAEVAIMEPTDADMTAIKQAVEGYAAHFGVSASEILSAPFIKLAPVSSRPYGALYTY